MTHGAARYSARRTKSPPSSPRAFAGAPTWGRHGRCPWKC
ncbi:hypothetical protein D187_005499 [Cystobacter fuscus DSM 2262]|uniref:Uncharacterized protein n=1 Tax=Cystobacter fuscus (strain ATCC 25194 / DSM 2262 / NBRC 100088 / M29) TaxID=1242864 RepID=S9PJ87_CYSF2|nr:hypothetical protein D187_005499 [Cystobacter fuscus DSM 2262]